MVEGSRDGTTSIQPFILPFKRTLLSETLDSIRFTFSYEENKMPMPYYVSPEQIMQDKRRYAEDGIKKGKDVIALEYKDGIILVAENPHETLNKISEMYDRIAFAAVGLYPEYEPLRFQGVQAAEVKGLTYSREDVNARWLANIYSQTIGSMYRQMDAKPLEIELLLVEVGDDFSPKNAIYHIFFDGHLWEEKQFAVIGGHAEEFKEYLGENYVENLTLSESLKLAVNTLSTIEDVQITPTTLEVVVLNRNQERRKFKRIASEEVAALLAESV